VNPLAWEKRRDGFFYAVPLDGCSVSVSLGVEGGWWCRIETPLRHAVVAETRRKTEKAAKSVAAKRFAKEMAKSRADAQALADRIDQYLNPITLAGFPESVKVPGVYCETRFEKGAGK
jgi:hypothetical protein